MGAFKNPNFVAEFSYRTQWNYFTLRSLQETDPQKTVSINKKNSGAGRKNAVERL